MTEKILHRRFLNYTLRLELEYKFRDSTSKWDTNTKMNDILQVENSPQILDCFSDILDEKLLKEN